MSFSAVQMYGLHIFILCLVFVLLIVAQQNEMKDMRKLKKVLNLI